MRKYLALLLLLLLPGCGGGGSSSSNPVITTVEEAKQPAVWTILVYLDADNDLERAGIINFNQMEAVGSTRDVHIIVQMDRIKGYDSSNGDWTNTRRYLITRDNDRYIMNSVRLDDGSLGECDMGNPQTLRDFVQWGVSEFPAEHYCLIMWDHGSGWEFRSLSTEPKYKYIAADFTTRTGMNVTDIPAALRGINLDVIAFDACHMQQLEVAYELRNSAGYMVGSAATEPSPGYNYSDLLGRISGKTTPRELAKTIVSSYAGTYPSSYSSITQSAVDLSRIEDLAQSASQFAQMLSNNNSSGLAVARNNSLDYSASSGYRFYYLDLLDYAKNCASQIGTAADPYYASLDAAFRSVIIAETHSPEMARGAYGVGIYVPPAGTYNTQYGRLQFAADTQWDEWLQAQSGR